MQTKRRFDCEVDRRRQPRLLVFNVTGNRRTSPADMEGMERLRSHVLTQLRDLPKCRFLLCLDARKGCLQHMETIAVQICRFLSTSSTVPATFSHEGPTEKCSDPEKMLVAKSTCDERYPYGHPVLTSKRRHVYDGHVQPLQGAS